MVFIVNMEPSKNGGVQVDAITACHCHERA